MTGSPSAPAVVAVTIERFYVGAFRLALLLTGLSGLALAPRGPSVVAAIACALVGVAALATAASTSWSEALLREMRSHQWWSVVVGVALSQVFIALDASPTSPLWYVSNGLLIVVAVAVTFPAAVLAASAAIISYVIILGAHGHSLPSMIADGEWSGSVATMGSYLLWSCGINAVLDRLIVGGTVGAAPNGGRSTPKLVGAPRPQAALPTDALEPSPAKPSDPRPHGLTARQLQALGLLAQGLRTYEIAAALSISPRQVRRLIDDGSRRAGAPTPEALIAQLIRSETLGTPA